MRPGVEKRGAHGLFNEKDEPIILDRVANEVANHPGNVWSHVISLRREDAIRLGYDNSDRWRELVMRHINDIAEQTRIPLCNLKWYGAFHDTTHHPHIHLIVYSTNSKQGFLTKQGIDKIRSVFANDIFHDDLQSIYQEQTFKRDELKMESKRYVDNLSKKIQTGELNNPQLENLVRKLKNQLDNSSGKKVYGYLKLEVKKTVDEIFKLISQDENIAELYEKWCELERQKYKAYTQKEKEFPPLWENKVFQPVRNMIIQQVMNMNFLVPEINSDRLPDADYDLDIAPPNDELIVESFVPTNHIENEGSYNISAEQGNEFAQNLLENTEQYESEMLADTVLGLFANLSRIIADDYNQKFQSGRISVDRKVRRMIQEKKQALGQQEEHIQSH